MFERLRDVEERARRRRPPYDDVMPEPSSAVALQAAAVRGFRTFEDVIDDLPRERWDAPFPAPDGFGESHPAGRDRDLQDVLNHLHAWHELLLGWLDAVDRGRRPAYPAEGYRWAELDVLNLKLRDRYRIRDAAHAWARLQASHAAALGRVSGISEDVLFDEERFDWLDGALAEPAHECLGGHYAWAVEAISARA